MSSISIPTTYAQDLLEMSNAYTEGAKAISAASQMSIQYNQFLDDIRTESGDAYSHIASLEKSLDEISNSMLAAAISFNTISTAFIENLDDFLNDEIASTVFKQLSGVNLKEQLGDDYKKLSSILGKEVTAENITEEDTVKLLLSSDGVAILQKLLNGETKKVLTEITKKALSDNFNNTLKDIFISYGIPTLVDFNFENFSVITDNLTKFALNKASKAIQTGVQEEVTGIVNVLTDGALSSTAYSTGNALLKNSLSLFGTIGVNVVNQAIKAEGFENLKAEDYQKIVGEAVAGMVGTGVVNALCGTATICSVIPVASLVAVPVGMFSSYLVGEVVNDINYINGVIPKDFEGFNENDVEIFKETYGIATGNVTLASFGNENQFLASNEMRNAGYSEEIINLTCFMEGDDNAIRYMLEVDSTTDPPVTNYSPKAQATLDFLKASSYSTTTTYNEEQVREAAEFMYKYTPEQLEDYMKTLESLNSKYASSEDQVIRELQERYLEIESTLRTQKDKLSKQTAA